MPRPKPAREPQICTVCGSSFDFPTKRPFCSRKCYQAAGRISTERLAAPDGAVLIPLSAGKVAIVDQSDRDAVIAFTWSYRHGYAGRAYAKEGRSVHEYLHRFLMSPPPDMAVDHINGDRLDNRRSNLRVVSIRENNFNQPRRKDGVSRYKGVTKNGTNRWRVLIAGKHLGYFQSETDAAKAYDAEAVKMYGELARVNFPA